MADEIELFVSRTIVPDGDAFSWQFYTDTVFTEADFHLRSRSKAHRQVRRRADHYAITEDDLPHRLAYFHAPSAVVRRRLEIQGYTRQHCRRAWEDARRAHVARWRQTSHPERAAEIEAIARIDVDDWLAGLRGQEAKSPLTFVGGRLGPWHVMSVLDGIGDPLVRLALLCDGLRPGAVWMDLSHVFTDDEDRRTPHQVERDEAAEIAGYPSGKIILLTEGKSDSRIIRLAMSALYPELADAYQFLDFEEYRIEGGASLLARMVKTLAGARVQNRMLALFDNDAAGVEARASLDAVRLPRNVRLMLLPDTRLADRYPTLGPDGARVMDVNGAGAPIELYLGRASLADAAGLLRPVRWNQWIERVGRYHGVVTDKDNVAKAFEAAMTDGRRPTSLRRAYPEMNLLLRRIFGAFEDQAPPA